jgi:hypothetical protein
MSPLKTFVASAAIATLASGAQAAEGDAPADPIAQLQQQLGVRDQVIRNLIRRIEQLEQAVGTMQPQATAAAEPVAAAPVQAGEGPTAAELDLNRLRTAFQRTLIDRGGLVLPQSTFEVDTSLSYSHSSAEALTIDGFTIFPVLIVGDVVSERIQRDTMTAAATARLGLPWDMQAELRVPYIHDESSRLSGSGEEKKLSSSGLGDVELALSRQLWSSRDGGVDVLGSVRWKAATGDDAFGASSEQLALGSGFNAVSASFTAVSVLDPVVFFGGLSYTHTLCDEKSGLRIAPGDAFGLQFGTALALNLDTSINFAVAQQFARRTEVNGQELPGSYVNTGTLSIGLSRVLMSGTSFDSSLIIGLSEDSPDLQLAFSMPFRSGR